MEHQVTRIYGVRELVTRKVGNHLSYDNSHWIYCTINSQVLTASVKYLAPKSSRLTLSLTNHDIFVTRLKSQMLAFSDVSRSMMCSNSVSSISSLSMLTREHDHGGFGTPLQVLPRVSALTAIP